MDSNQLLIGGDLAATWSDNSDTACSVLLSVNDQTVASGDSLLQAGTLTLRVADTAGNTQTAQIELTADNTPIFGLESLNALYMQVDQPVNLLSAITLGRGVTLVNVILEMGGERKVFADPSNFVPPIPGTCRLLFTVS